jgi:hypothetical protein
MLIPFGVLSAAAGGAPAGASDYELIATEILTTSQSSVTFSSLGTYSADYKHLQVRATVRRDFAETFGGIHLRFNGDTSSSYVSHRLRGNGSAVQATYYPANTYMELNQVLGSTSPTGSFSAFVTDILDFSSTTKKTTVRTFQGSLVSDQVALLSGLYDNTAAITQISFGVESGNYIAGCRFSLYGLRG